MRLCGVTTRFHRVTKLVSGHTVSSWMGGKRNRVVEGKGRRRDGRRKKWRKEKLGREREEEREERKVWWMAPCVGEGWTAISSRRKKILGCIVFKDRGKGSKKLARVWCSATSDGERVFAIQSGAFRPLKHSCSHGDEKEGGGIDAAVKNNVGWKRRAVKIKLESGGYFEKRN